MRRGPQTPAGSGGPPGPSLEQAKERAVATLSEHFAQDRLRLEDFERLVDAVESAESAADVQALTRGLASGRPIVAPGGPPAPGEALQAVAPAGEIRPRDQAVAVFGEAKREGAWTPAEDTKAVAVMGSVVLDFREARVAARDVSVLAVSFFGSVEIVVPPGTDVECGASAVFGSVEHHTPRPSAPAPGAAGTTVRIRGVSVFGSVEVHYRYPGESKREAKRRLRLEKRRRRKRGR